MRPGRTTFAAAASVLVAGCSREPSALDPAGRGAREIAVLWWVMFGLGVAVFVLVVGILLRTARRDRDDPDPQAAERTGHRWMLLGGVVLPVAVVLPISVLTLVIGDRLWGRDAAGGVQVELIGNQFWWEVRYPETGAVTANEIHIPAGEDVQITMSSDDVIHSFWVPSLHGKMDLIPGEVTSIVIDADRPGRYEALCAEFCGIQHAHMKLLVVAHERDDFEAWLRRESDDARPPGSALARVGAERFDQLGCASCHTVRGTGASGQIGPDLTHIASRLTLGANTIPNTRGNLGGWIANPQSIKPGNLMPPSVLDAGDLRALLAYLEDLE